MRIPKGFVSLGSEGNWLNKEYIDESRCYLDRRIDKIAVVDIYGKRYNVDKKLCKGKINWKE